MREQDCKAKMSKKIVNIQRVSLLQYSFARSTPDAKRSVAQALTYENPNKYDLYRKKEMFSKVDFTFFVGLLPDVIGYCRAHNIQYYVDDWVFDNRQLQIDERLTGKYQHQADAVKAFFKRRVGILKVPTRGGKTFIASEILRQFLLAESEGTFLFTVDTEDLFRQAMGDIQSFFEPYGGIEIGEIRGGVWEPRRVTIAMVQTLQRAATGSAARKRELKNLLMSVKFLTVDEIHDNCSKPRMDLFKKCKNISYQLCLSATPYRAEAWYPNLKLRAWSGDIIYEIDEKVLQQRMVLTQYEVMMLCIDHESQPYAGMVGDYRELQDAIIHNNRLRNNVLLMVTALVKKLGLKTLVLFQSVEHGKWYSAHTGIPFIWGSTTAAERDEEKRRFLASDGGLLAASGIFKKGVTLPAAQIMINVDGGLEDANTVQKKGRVLGYIDGKDVSAIIDFVDVYEQYFSDHSSSRLQTYLDAVGERGVHIVDAVADGWIKTVEQWLRNWFHVEKNDSIVTR